ncbi:MAG: hypothetical protein KFW09_04310 [Oscillospiraceae bacterium]|nr:hypothetical protein [Oscillospiraceae bacterium]
MKLFFSKRKIFYYIIITIIIILSVYQPIKLIDNGIHNRESNTQDIDAKNNQDIDLKNNHDMNIDDINIIDTLSKEKDIIMKNMQYKSYLDNNLDNNLDNHLKNLNIDEEDLSNIGIPNKSINYKIKPSIGNSQLLSTDMYMYINRGFRDTIARILDPTGEWFSSADYTITRKVEKFESMLSDNIIPNSEKTLPAYIPNEDITLGVNNRNSYGKYRITYSVDIPGYNIEDGIRIVKIIPLRGDINKDGVVNGSYTDNTPYSDMGLFNLIVSRNTIYNNSENDADYIINLSYNKVKFNPLTSPSSVFRVHNQERLNKLIGNPNNIHQVIPFLIPEENIYFNKHLQ